MGIPRRLEASATVGGSTLVGFGISEFCLTAIEHYEKLEVLVKFQDFIGPGPSSLLAIIAVALGFYLIAQGNKEEIRQAINRSGKQVAYPDGTPYLSFKPKRLRLSIMVVVATILVLVAAPFGWALLGLSQSITVPKVTIPTKTLAELKSELTKDVLTKSTVSPGASPTKTPSQPTITTIIQGPCGVIQNGGVGNQATGGNCAPPEPPPAIITLCTSSGQSVPSAEGDFRMVITLTTNSQVIAPRYNFWFSGPVMKQTAVSSPDIAMNIREVASDSRFAFQIFQTWFPTQRLNIAVRSIGAVQLVKQSGEHQETFNITKDNCNSGI
jgi:hypothetical protein